MFTIEQIAKAHSKVRSGADFPAYIRDIKQLGVVHYETFVSDGHTEYYGEHDYKRTSPAKYNPLDIPAVSDKKEFNKSLKAHQKGETDYPTFCQDAAKAGVEKWVVSMSKMTCTYYDRSGAALLVEQVPG